MKEGLLLTRLVGRLIGQLVSDINIFFFCKIVFFVSLKLLACWLFIFSHGVFVRRSFCQLFRDDRVEGSVKTRIYDTAVMIVCV